MKTTILTLDNKAAGDIDLSDDVFGLEPRKDILARMVNYQLAKRRAGTHKVKNRAEVAGNSQKIYKQKGTGRARQGNGKAPHFRGGGRAFGPTPRDHAHDLPKKVRRLALKMALSAKAADGKLIILDDAVAAEPKTKAVKAQFLGLGLNSALIVGGAEVDRNFALAARNIAQIDVLPIQGANVYDILRRDTLVLTKAAVEGLEARLK
ncbi:50S ribosomal protein L4 [Rhodospirillaceae bacterium KN72]|uniref:Large ribosomal subunit protein uL4 n=1 Tax=Pacificispira spongiicola TaxID=2729598 RepID=A0A7Y0E3H2_9PROT|nr:50S ribosomal protein L4 [Pacificispira spongiicola]NMM46577.1 50S ribosomal protein L4 [Pacificispira spongiicola]